MKTIEEILGRKDYKNLTPQLKERVEDIAYRICKKLVQLDETDTIIIIKGERKCDNVEVAVRKVSSNLSRYVYLAMNCSTELDSEYECQDWRSLEDVDDCYNLDGDFTARVRGASTNAALRFLNVAGQIIAKIGEIEERKVLAINKALAETSNI